MGQIHLILGGALLFTYGLKVLTMPLEDGIIVRELDIESSNSSIDLGNSSMDEETFDIYKPNCYLVKNDSGLLITVNMTREEAGNDTYLDYEETCDEIMFTRRLSPGALASLAGK